MRGGIELLEDAPGGGPVFILTGARSGSTLLRLILDGHPEVASPGELNLVALFQDVRSTCSALAVDDSGASVRSAELCRRLAAETIGLYAHAAGKRRWCEKSLPNAENADFLLEVFPEAQFVCLYRECTDTIVSLAEACAWGFGGYGVEPYVHQDPTNLPWALSRYWADKSETILAFEETHPDICFRVRYEDLVTDPNKTLTGLFSFLAISQDSEALSAQRIFSNPTRNSVGDHKLRYMRDIAPDSVGRGWTVPVEWIPAPFRFRINEISVKLGYPPLETEAHQARRALRGACDAAAAAVGLPRPSLTELMDRAALELATRMEIGEGAGQMRLVVADDPMPFLVDFERKTVSREDVLAPYTLLTDSETLIDIASGRCNPGTAIRQSRLRLSGGDGQPMSELLVELDQLVSIIRPESTRGASEKGEQWQLRQAQ